MRRLIHIVLYMIIAASLFAGGSSEEIQQEEQELTLYVSILPQTYLVETIGGDRVNVEVMVPPGKSPSTYEPTPRQVTSLGNADGFFTIGVAFEEAFLPVIESNLPELPVIVTDAGIEKRTIEGHAHDEDDEHGHDEEEEHENLDPHIWMDPILMIEQAGIIRDALIDLDAAGHDSYTRGYEQAVSELKALDELLVERLAPLEGSTLFVYHPAFGYFADRYGLQQIAIETGGNEPTPAQLESLIEEAIEHGTKMIFVQPEFSKKSAQAVADAIGGTVIPVAPLRPDYLENLQEISEALTQGAL